MRSCGDTHSLQQITAQPAADNWFPSLLVLHKPVAYMIPAVRKVAPQKIWVWGDSHRRLKSKVWRKFAIHFLQYAHFLHILFMSGVACKVTAVLTPAGWLLLIAGDWWPLRHSSDCAGRDTGHYRTATSWHRRQERRTCGYNPQPVLTEKLPIAPWSI